MKISGDFRGIKKKVKLACKYVGRYKGNKVICLMRKVFAFSMLQKAIKTF